MSNTSESETAYLLLLESVGRFNAWRLEHLDERLDFRGKDFTDRDLSGALFVNADLSGAKFAESALNGAIFCASALESADLMNAQICNALFGPPELLDAALDPRLASRLLRAANLKKADFRGADLTGSVLRDTNVEGADFGYTALDCVDFRGANYQAACFEKAYLAETLFDGEDPPTDVKC